MKVKEESLSFVIFKEKIDNACLGYLGIYLFKNWEVGWDTDLKFLSGSLIWIGISTGKCQIYCFFKKTCFSFNLPKKTLVLLIIQILPGPPKNQMLNENHQKYHFIYWKHVLFSVLTTWKHLVNGHNFSLSLTVNSFIGNSLCEL